MKRRGRPSAEHMRNAAAKACALSKVFRFTIAGKVVIRMKVEHTDAEIDSIIRNALMQTYEMYEKDYKSDEHVRRILPNMQEILRLQGNSEQRRYTRKKDGSRSKSKISSRAVITMTALAASMAVVLTVLYFQSPVVEHYIVEITDGMVPMAYPHITRTISGSITLAGVETEGAAVEFINTEHKEVRSKTETDAQGGFKKTGIREGTYDVILTMPDGEIAKLVLTVGQTLEFYENADVSDDGKVTINLNDIKMSLWLS